MKKPTANLPRLSPVSRWCTGIALGLVAQAGNSQTVQAVQLQAAQLECAPDCTTQQKEQTQKVLTQKGLEEKKTVSPVMEEKRKLLEEQKQVVQGPSKKEPPSPSLEEKRRLQEQKVMEEKRLLQEKKLRREQLVEEKTVLEEKRKLVEEKTTVLEEKKKLVEGPGTKELVSPKPGTQVQTQAPVLTAQPFTTTQQSLVGNQIGVETQLPSQLQSQPQAQALSAEQKVQVVNLVQILAQYQAVGKELPPEMQELMTSLLSSLTPEQRAMFAELKGLLATQGEQGSPDPITRGDLAKVLAEQQGSEPGGVVYDIQGLGDIGSGQMPTVASATAGFIEGTSEEPGFGGSPPGLTPSQIVELLLKNGIVTEASLGTEIALEEQVEKTVPIQSGSGFPYNDAGKILPFASWPTSLAATYNGRISGTRNDGAGVGGNISMFIDFSTGHAAGGPGFAIPGSITFDEGKGGTTFTLPVSGGYIGGNMSGTYEGQAVTGYIMDGQVYGPQAQEIGGKWSMQNGSASMTAGGKFAAKR